MCYGLSIILFWNSKLTTTAAQDASEYIYSLPTHLPPNLEVYTLDIQSNLNIILGTVSLENKW